MAGETMRPRDAARLDKLKRARGKIQEVVGRMPKVVKFMAGDAAIEVVTLLCDVVEDVILELYER
jgi:hypothetical protein